MLMLKKKIIVLNLEIFIYHSYLSKYVSRNNMFSSIMSFIPQVLGRSNLQFPPRKSQVHRCHRLLPFQQKDHPDVLALFL